jgi:tetratricopeptide (TPR) repeat protein
MSSCIPLLYLACTAYLTTPVLAQSPAAGRVPAVSPDALYAERADLAKARHAAAIWQAALEQNSADFDAAWKRARAAYWIAGHLPTDAAQKAEYEAGMAAARLAVTARPNQPEGHFWLAANMGALAEIGGIGAGLRYRGRIRDSLERVLEIDPAFQQGSADRALGRWYHLVPGLFGGSEAKSEEHLRRSLSYNEDSIASRYFLAETLEERGRDEEARAELRRILDTPPDPDWVPEDREFKAKARAMLAKLAADQ